MNKKYLITDKIIGSGFVLYFLILFVERMYGGISGIYNGGSASIFGEGGGSYFAWISNITAICAAIIGMALAIKPMVNIFKTLFKKEIGNYNYKELCLASFFMLLSGMMHTGVVLSALQFTAYGLLIVALIALTIQYWDKSKGFDLIISVVFLIMFSMTVPVVYAPLGDNLFSKFGIFFVILEFISALVLDLIFHFTMYSFFKNKGMVNFNLGSLLIMLFLDVTIIIMSFILSIPDIFVLIFVSLSILTYFVGALKTRQGKDFKIDPFDITL